MLWKIASAIMLLGLTTACSASYDMPSGDAVSTEHAALPGSNDPLASDGTWLVPNDVPYGTYRTVSTDASYPGYWYTCADLACEIDFDGNGKTGRTGAQIVNGPGFLVLDDTTQFVHIERLILTPVTTQ